MKWELGTKVDADVPAAWPRSKVDADVPAAWPRSKVDADVPAAWPRSKVDADVPAAWAPEQGGCRRPGGMAGRRPGGAERGRTRDPKLQQLVICWHRNEHGGCAVRAQGSENAAGTSASTSPNSRIPKFPSPREGARVAACQKRNIPRIADAWWA